ncbi:hypothetical protein BC834DRAFT_884505 [Gloeopeniophorella convolvens]|nr:hypothetical protein BC834DRAFT_884505 [Gloeopeniophorella convolvens]
MANNSSNVDINNNIANGARGIIEAIVVHEDEDVPEEDKEVVLNRPPAYILVKLERTRAPQLKGLGNNVVPIVPLQRKFDITMSDNTGRKKRKTVTRRQLPITAAYTFTDYRVQGQTIPKVVVDIAPPPTGSNLSMYNMYVALSRSLGRDSIRILRPFDEKSMLQPIDEAL